MVRLSKVSLRRERARGGCRCGPPLPDGVNEIRRCAQIRIEGTPLERKAVRSVLLRNFTDDERRQMRGLTIRIVPDLFDSQVGTIAGRWTHRGGTRRQRSD